MFKIVFLNDSKFKLLIKRSLKRQFSRKDVVGQFVLFVFGYRKKLRNKKTVVVDEDQFGKLFFFSVTTF